VGELSCLLVKSIQSTAIRSHPQRALPVLVNGRDVVVTQAVGVVGVVLVVNELFLFLIKSVETAAARANPKRAFPILVD
jgi:hypothetical protein